VATQQPGLKPGELYHLGGPALIVVCSLHLPKIIEFYLRIQMLPAKLQLASLYESLRGPPCIPEQEKGLAVAKNDPLSFCTQRIECSFKVMSGLALDLVAALASQAFVQHIFYVCGMLCEVGVTRCFTHWR